MRPRIVLSRKLREIIRLPRWLLCVFPLLHTRELARRLWKQMCRLRTLLLVVGIGDILVVWLMMGTISSAIEIVGKWRSIVTDRTYSWLRQT